MERTAAAVRQFEALADPLMGSGRGAGIMAAVIVCQGHGRAQRTVRGRQGYKADCIEEIAWRAGWIDGRQLRALARPLTKSGYGRYLVELLENR